MKIPSFFINFVLDLTLKTLVYGIFLAFCKLSNVGIHLCFHYYRVKYQMRIGTTC